jgi:ATP-dependent exoDNAse (exonuclease V) alpha subunit
MSTASIGDIDLNPEFAKAFDLMENSSKNVFVTGRAGTGKSTLLQYFRNNSKKKSVILAPTGVAALNVQGQTIHSFFHFKPDITPDSVRKLKNNWTYSIIDAIVIDEISMTRADLLDCVDRFMRLNGRNRQEPFGGCQMILIGDLYQLPPVVSGREKELFRTHYTGPYFFNSHAIKAFEMEFVELEKNYRQKDEKFINLLNSIRNNTLTSDDIEMLNTRLNPGFTPPENDFYLTLTTTNDDAATVNDHKLSMLPHKAFEYQAKIRGSLNASHYPTNEKISLKKDAQVMLLNNDPGKRWVNGSIGKIMEIQHSEEEDIIDVQLTSGENVQVAPHKWEVFDFFFDKGSKRIETNVIGSFTQYPMRLAWAVTIHKAQGKTFDKVVIDFGKGTFAHGQAYVALSRCRTLDGIVLKKPLEKKHVYMDWRVVKFQTSFQYRKSEEEIPLSEKIALIDAAIAGKIPLEITYLKANDIKSRRIVLPKKVGEFEYMGKNFLGLSAYCMKRNENRNFRIDRILEIKQVGKGKVDPEIV